MRYFAAMGLIAATYNAASAFETIGFRSGMNVADVQAAAPPGYDLRMFSNGSGVVVRGDDIYAALGFCLGHLVSVSRSIDADRDWLPFVQDALRQRGRPQVLTEAQPWTGPGGGDIHSFLLRWADKDSRYELSLSPEERDGAGKLRHTRGASENSTLTSANPCFRAESKTTEMN